MTLLSTYGRWTVIGEPQRVRRAGRYVTMVPCRCSCQREAMVRKDHLLDVTSQGCEVCRFGRERKRPQPRPKRMPQPTLPSPDSSPGRPYDLVSMDGPGAIPRRILETP